MSESRILFLCPTRDRPALHKRMAESFLATNPQHTKLVFRIDDDQQEQYERIQDSRILYLVGRRVMIGPKANEVAIKHAKKYDLIVVGSDETIFITHDWEKQVLEAHDAGAHSIVTGDGRFNDLLPAYLFFDTKIVQAMGYLYPPCLEHLCIDVFLMLLSKALGGFAYVPTAIIKHDEPDNVRNGGGDAQTTRCNSLAQYDKDDNAFDNYLDTTFWTDAEKCGQALNVPITRIELPKRKRAANKYFSLDAAGQMDINVKKVSQECRLFMATPCYGDMLTAGYVQSLMQTVQFFNRCGIRNKLHLHRNNSDVALARNLCVASFLATDFTHIMFIDADIQWPPQEPMRMLGMDLPVLGGLYARKIIMGDSVSEGITPVGEISKLAETIHGAVQAERLPGGFLLIKREVFETIMQKRPDLKWDLGETEGDKGVESIKPFVYAFFEHGMNFKTHQYIGEDYAFCDLCRECEIPLWGDLLAVLGHTGGYTFTTQPWKILSKDNTNLGSASV